MSKLCNAGIIVAGRPGYTKTFNVPLNPDSKDTNEKKETISVKVRVFESGTPEDWCEFRTEVNDLFESAGYNTTAIQVKVYKSLLKGKISQEFITCYNKRFNGVPGDNEARLAAALKKLLNDLALKIFPDGEGATRAQKRYLRNNLHMGRMDPVKFHERLDKINTYIEFFPIKAIGMTKPPNKPLVEDEIIGILDFAKPIQDACPGKETPHL